MIREAGRPGRPPERVTTHISDVVIGADTVFKLKRPVVTGYLDFGSAEKRLAFCREEVAINRRSAPMIYRGVRRITREADGRLAFDGEGALVDAVVEMAPFDQNNLLDRMAAAGPLDDRLIERLAAAIADFHKAAGVSPDPAGTERLRRVLAINAEAFVRCGLLAPNEARELAGLFDRACDRLAELLDERARAGFVRHGHGDLHLRNIVVIDGEPVPFDALEFDVDLATSDVLYDLAFLVMDLWHRDRQREAALAMNCYADSARETTGLRLMGFLVAVRAAVRAHVLASSGQRDEAMTYVDLARAALVQRSATLIAIGGLSGSGKSSVATALAPMVGSIPGARILSSDRLRKRHFGVGPEVRLPPEAYRPEITGQVYADLAHEAAIALDSGLTVIADAVHARAEERAAIEHVARRRGIAFQGVWLDLPMETRLSRVGARTGGPSDANVSVAAQQSHYDLGQIDWLRLDAATTPSDLAERIATGL